MHANILELSIAGQPLFGPEEFRLLIFSPSFSIRDSWSAAFQLKEGEPLLAFLHLLIIITFSRLTYLDPPPRPCTKTRSATAFPSAGLWTVVRPKGPLAFSTFVSSTFVRSVKERLVKKLSAEPADFRGVSRGGLSILN